VQKMRSMMIQGTASGVGKSVLATLFCRFFSRQGYRVAPFKAQNITTVCYETSLGSMGKSQAIQAWASGTEPHPSMNPLLLCPLPGGKVDVYLCGELLGRMSWEDYRMTVFASAREKIGESLRELSAAYDMLIVEGAGSPVEVNLSATDLANVFTARLSGFPVFLVADIDRGGVFASLVGTLSLMEQEDRERVAGLMINKFKGEAGLFQEGIDFLEKRTGLPVLAVFPHFDSLPIEDEDELVSKKEMKKFSGMEPGTLREKLDSFIPLLEKSLDLERFLQVVTGKP
jgi:adenosylcobyric acid synthase